MKDRDDISSLIAAYHAGRLEPADRAEFELRVAADPRLAAEVERLAPVSDWIREGFGAAPDDRAFRLSADRAALIRAAARGDIVTFPAAHTESRRPSRVVDFARRYGLVAAVAVAVTVGAVSGFESGRFQVAESSRPILIAVDRGEDGSGDVATDIVYLYPPAYGLDHADFTAMTSRVPAGRDEAAVGFAVQPRRDYGLPGPSSPYLRSREILFLQ